MTALAFIDTETTGLDPELHQIWEVGLIMRGAAFPAMLESIPEEGTHDYWYRWFLPVDLSRADPKALEVSGFHDRHPTGDNAPKHTRDYSKPVMTSHPSQVACSCGGRHFDDWQLWDTPSGKVEEPHVFAETLELLTVGAHLVGAVVSFDEKRLEKLLRANGVMPAWHYHIVDVEALAAGWLMQWSRGPCGPPGTERSAENLAVARAIAEPPWDSDELSNAIGIDPSLFHRHEAVGDAQWARSIYDRCMG